MILESMLSILALAASWFVIRNRMKKGQRRVVEKDVCVNNNLPFDKDPHTINLLRLMRLCNFQLSYGSNPFVSVHSINSILSEFNMSHVDFIVLAEQIEREMPTSLALENPIWGAIECLRFLTVEKEYGGDCVAPSSLIGKALGRPIDADCASIERTLITYLNSTVHTFGPVRTEWWRLPKENN